jgi:transcriptional regulator with XRE-family HTH domain
MSLGLFLRDLRLNRGLLQKELAKLLRVQPSYVSNLERGVRVSIGADMRQRLAEALELTPSEMARLDLLIRATKGPVPLPSSATEQELQLVYQLADCIGRLPISHLQLIRLILEPWSSKVAGDVLPARSHAMSL